MTKHLFCWDQEEKGKGKKEKEKEKVGGGENMEPGDPNSGLQGKHLLTKASHQPLIYFLVLCFCPSPYWPTLLLYQSLFYC